MAVEIQTENSLIADGAGTDQDDDDDDGEENQGACERGTLCVWVRVWYPQSGKSCIGGVEERYPEYIYT